jgi:gas vesicle protein
MGEEKRKKGILGKLIVGGAIGSVLAIAFGTKKGREKTQEMYEEIKEKIDVIREEE